LHKICKQIREILNSADKRPAKGTGMLPSMAKIIPVAFKRPRLPKSLLRDGWWLESQPTVVVAFAKSPRKPNGSAASTPKPNAPHLTLVHSRK
jgi:hypothetical protein